MCEQSRPSASGSFSARFTRAITRCVIGLPSLLGDIACGVRRFSCGKNERVGERALRRATSHPARFTRHLPLKGKAFA